MSRFPVVVSCLLVAGHIVAGDVASDGVRYLESEYIVDSWQTDQGLPDNFVNAITQTTDGYLWIATFNGLARFNGVEFGVFDSANTPALPSSRITALHGDRQGRLWILSEYADLSLWAGGRFRALAEKSIRTVRDDTQGTVWAAGWPGLTNYFCFTNGALTPVTTEESHYHRFGNATDRSGHGWGIRSNRLFSVNPAALVDAPIPNFDSSYGWRLAASADGGMWVISERVQKFRQGWFDDYGPLPVGTHQIGQKMIEDQRGNLWIGTGVGELWRLGTNRVFQRFRLENSTASEIGKVIFEDAEANLWVSTSGSGLLRLKPRALKTYSASDGLKSDVVRSVTEDSEGNIWLATVNSIDWITAQKPIRAEPRGVTASLPWKVHAARNGGVWIGTFSKGVLRVHGKDQQWFRASLTGDSPIINAIFEDRGGEMYFGTPQGLYGLDSDSLAAFAPPPELPTPDVRAIAKDSRGGLYLACNGQGLVRKTDASWERFTSSHGLPGNHLWGLHVDAEDTVWIGLHGHGLSRFKDGRFFNFGESVELPRLITCIIEDEIGRLWFASNQGLYYAARSQLNAVADRRASTADITHYSRADGMGSSQCTGNAWKARDGKLWFTTMGGVTVVDPRSLPRNVRPPPVVVERVLIDDKAVADATGEVKVPAGAHRLEFHYAGLSFTVPERVRFQYRLKGFDKEWVKAENRRAAYYTKLPPGSYQFEVIACNNDNLWSAIPGRMGVTVMRYFWQTGWFLALGMVSAGSGVFGVYKFRIMQLKRARLWQENFSRRLIESQENERKRIAAELHDSLGQNLLVVKNYAALALRENTTPEKMREQLEDISQTAMASIEEVRSIARALRPYQLDRFGLTKTLEDAAELLARAGSLQIETQIGNVDEAFALDAQVSIFRVVQEWLNNVVKHAHASAARLTVRNDGAAVRIILEDNGVGFDYTAVMSRTNDNGTFGLTNLRERVRLLGGTLKIETAPGKGTRLCVDLPLKNRPLPHGRGSE